MEFGYQVPSVGLPLLKRMAIIQALRLSQGRKRDAAEALQMGRTTLYRKMREFEIRDDEWRMPHGMHPVVHS